MTTAIEPATTISSEAVSTKAAAFSEMAMKMRPKAPTKPTIVAISMNRSSKLTRVKSPSRNIATPLAQLIDNKW